MTASGPLEGQIAPQVVQAMQSSGCQIWRNNRGLCKIGKSWIRYGVGPNGAGDYIGFMPVRITPEMVGHYVAVFVAPETKRPIGAKYDPKQCDWKNSVLAAGGIAGFAHSWEQGREMVTNWYARFKICKSDKKPVRKKRSS